MVRIYGAMQAMQILLHRVLSLPDVIELVIVRMRDNWLYANWRE